MWTDSYSLDENIRRARYRIAKLRSKIKEAINRPDASMPDPGGGDIVAFANTYGRTFEILLSANRMEWGMSLGPLSKIKLDDTHLAILIGLIDVNDAHDEAHAPPEDFLRLDPTACQSPTGPFFLFIGEESFRPTDSIAHTMYRLGKSGVTATAAYALARWANSRDVDLAAAHRFCAQWPEGPQPKLSFGPAKWGKTPACRE